MIEERAVAIVCAKCRKMAPSYSVSPCPERDGLVVRVNCHDEYQEDFLPSHALEENWKVLKIVAFSETNMMEARK